MTLENLKEKVRAVGARYDSRHDRAKRIFIEERAASLASDREREYDIKNIISNYFDIPYAHVCFAGSSQLGFSVKKEKLFQPGISDLDVACIDGGLYHQAWIDIIETTSAFTNFSGFDQRSRESIALLQDQILRRGMIRIDAMPKSPLKLQWSQFQRRLGRNHTDLFSSISVAIYMNEYAFCWKQDSALTIVMR